MHLMSCEHPIRVFNKYINQWVWTTCGKCNSCKNRRAKMWTDACERERSYSKFTLFVTLTYDEYSLPLYNVTGGFDSEKDISVISNCSEFILQSTRLPDKECVTFSKDSFDIKADRELFDYYLENKGIPYASRSDIQLFHKRLNKWFFQNVSDKYKNFRYFVVSEYGSTTLRPHFHALYFVNDEEVARRFSDGIMACWKYGRYDCQYVENSACSYVAQYINKLHDLPSFYRAKQIRPFFLCSRNPIIGSMYEHSQSDEEIFNNSVVQTFDYSRKDSRLVLHELDKSTENRLFPKCPSYREVSYSMRVKLYSVSSRFGSCKGFDGFCEEIRSYLRSHVGEFSVMLRSCVDGFSSSGTNWLRRLYYLSRKVCFKALRFGVSISEYVRKIDDYWNKKELHLINKMYEFQETYVAKDNRCLSDDLVLMYPDFLWSNGFTYGDMLKQYTPLDVIDQRETAKMFAMSNKRSHFKNLYLDSLKDKNNKFFLTLKKFYYAKECNEIIEALAT